MKTTNVQKYTYACVKMKRMANETLDDPWRFLSDPLAMPNLPDPPRDSGNLAGTDTPPAVPES